MSDHIAAGYVPRGLLSQLLRQLRARRGMQLEAAAAETGLAHATLWRIDKGDTRCRYSVANMELLSQLYGTDKDTALVLTELAVATRSQSWTGAYRDVLTDTATVFIDLEGHARRIRCYDNALIPDLLQHEKYARALVASVHHLDAAELGRHAKVRMTRQRVLEREPAITVFEFVLDENALRRAVGEAGVMSEQLRLLAERAERPNVSVRVVPYRSGTYPGLVTGSFTMLDFPVDPRYGGLPTTVRVERQGEDLLLDSRDEVQVYVERWNDIAGRALDEHGSRELILDAVDRFTR
jgi:transcriptional regulator with XRE-family HTH domain